MHFADALAHASNLFDELVLAGAHLILVEVTAPLSQRPELVDVIVNVLLLPNVSQVQFGQVLLVVGLDEGVAVVEVWWTLAAGEARGRGVVMLADGVVAANVHSFWKCFAHG